jgi:hypothetical protein
MSAFPSDWLCPITLQLMRDPVICADGYTYERTAISTWLSSNAISPMTRQALPAAALTPNLALRHTIEDYLAANPAPAPPAAAAAATPFINKPTTLDAHTFFNSGKHWLHVRVSAPPAGERQPIVLVPIIDNSGSMGSSAGAAAGSTEDHGFTRLDLVKHAVRTMSAILSDRDKMGLVSFSTDARILLTPTTMNATGKRRVEDALELLRPDSSTNIFDGIRKAAGMLADPAYAGHNIVAMLLTDGYPTINPPRGIVPSLATIPRPANWTLHTFGFGYDLDSALCTEIAEWGQGLFGFIPDASMVGTVFINSLAHVLSTANLNTAFTYKPSADGATLTVNTGPVTYGQPRDFLFEVSDTATFGGEPVSAGDPGHVLIHKMFIDVIARAISICRSGGYEAPFEAQRVLAEFEAQFSTLPDPIVKALLRDLRGEKEGEGQIGLAPTYFKRWGHHYMLAYKRAQELQQCMNFKDPGLQIYGGELFHALQDEGDRAFCDLPAPTPTGYRSSGYGPGAAGGGATLTSMAHFHNASAGCFAPETLIRCADGTSKMITDLKRGDQVWTPSGPATIRAVVVCGSSKRAQPMTMLEGLVVTPWHPVRRHSPTNRVSESVSADTDSHPVRRRAPHGVSGTWQFPADIAGYSDRLIPTVYNLVLDSGHVVLADGWEAITLAHGFEEPVAKHEFFGTDRVIQDLMKQPGWDEGRPVYKNLTTIRDAVTGTIIGWKDDV